MTRTIIWEGDTASGHYQVADTVYDGRPARVLYSGESQAAQSGVATDGNPDLLFDYNQRLYEFIMALDHQKVLIIGGGAGTLATALINTTNIPNIDIVEPDENITQLAYKYFDLPADERIKIYHTDGQSFLQGNTTKYDIVVLDAFHHTSIPSELMSVDAFRMYRAALTKHGVLLANIISTYHGAHSSPLKTMARSAQFAFENIELFRASSGYSLWLPQNFVLCALGQRSTPIHSLTRGLLIELP